MKVKELIQQLSKLDQESLVLMQKGYEGSAYRTLNGVSENEGIETEDYEYDFLSRYEDLQDMEDYYGDNLAFFSCTVLY